METVALRRLSALFLLEVGSRRVQLAGCTASPTGSWVTQQARNLGFTDLLERTRFLVRDRDRTFSASFDEVVRSEGIRVIRTPIRAPQANADAERFVRSVRAERLDWLLIAGRPQLERVRRHHVEYYNRERPHRGLGLSPPQPNTRGRASPTSVVERRDRLDGLQHEHYRSPA